MAVQAYPYLVITDGTTTITVQDGSGGATNYPLVRDGWAPAIAGLRASPLGGVSPYEDVAETMLIEVNGSTAANALANLATLQRVLEQAARWFRGEAVAAVLVKFAPHGSTISSSAAPLQAAILGGAAGPMDPGLRLSPRWDELGRNYVIPNVVLAFNRRGLWLLAEETSPTDTENNGEIAQVTFAAGAQNVLSPTKVKLTNFGYYKSTGTRYHGGFLIVGDAAGGDPMAIGNAETGTASGFTSVTPSGSTNPRNTNVLRYTPASTSPALSGSIMNPLFPGNPQLAGVFINVRPSTTVSFNVRARLDSDLENQYTPLVLIPAVSTQYPRWVFLGLVPIDNGVNFTYLEVTASAASSSLDIDTVVVIDALNTQVIALIGPGDSDTNGTAGTTTLQADHALLDFPMPSVAGTTRAVPYGGDPVIMTKAAVVDMLLLVTGGGTGANGDEYRQANSGSDAVLSNVWTLYRRPAYLVPQ